jgi:hypothetical protein
MKYAVEIGSAVKTYIPGLLKIVSGIETLIREHSQTHRRHGDFISLILL